MSNNENEQIEIEKYKLLFQLWISENPVKTGKLQTLMLVNSILVPAFLLTKGSVWIAMVGFLFSTVWIFSLGRTLNFQNHWLEQMEELRHQHLNNPIFDIHSREKKFNIWGKIPSRYFLLGSAVGSAIAWLAVILYIIIIN